jgi:hypothetical protein
MIPDIADFGAPATDVNINYESRLREGGSECSCTTFKYSDGVMFSWLIVLVLCLGLCF